MLPSHSQHIRTAIAFSPVPPPTCATQLRPHTCPAPPHPTSTTHLLHKNYPLHHALAKTEPIQLSFRDLSPIPFPTCAAQLRPSTHSNSPYPIQTTSPLCKNNPHRHALTKTEPTWLGFQNFVPNTPSPHITQLWPPTHSTSPYHTPTISPLCICKN